MTKRRYRNTWDDIAWLDADRMTGWTAIVPGRRDKIDSYNDELPKLASEMDDIEDKFAAFYQWPDLTDRLFLPVRSTAHVDRRACPLGGRRTYFICPFCGRRTLRLAVLQAGLICGTCGSVTWKSRREHKLDRLIRRGNEIAARLDCEAWHVGPTSRPKHMRRETYAAL